MTITATKFTPEVLLSAPRRSAASPNPTGTSALYMVSNSTPAMVTAGSRLTMATR